jgi:putative PIN family toxin of toxin-antitoxin system
VVGAALKREGVPRQALLKARREDVIALSLAVVAETREVLGRSKFATALTENERSIVLELLTDAAVWIEPTASVHDCRDIKDNMYLELAAAAGAEIIISSDEDLLVLDPWRGIRIVRPAAYLSLA